MYSKIANSVLALFLAGTINGQIVIFDNVTESAGISHDRRIYGTSIIDWNNDGFLDIFIASTSGNDYLFTSNGDMTYTEYFSAVGFSHQGNTAGALFADFDDDNDLDVFFGMRGGSNLFYENVNNEFIEIQSALADSDSSKAAGMGVADFNGDGLLDIYQSNWDAQNVLYNNEGEWVFSNVTENSNAMHTGVAMGMGFFDCDNDGDQDLYLTHDGYQGNKLYRNNSDGTFTNISAETNTGIQVQGMGVTFGDFDNNGFIDIYAANMDSNRLLINNGDGTFTDATVSAGVGDTGMGWGVVSFDYDNDGWLDIYVIP